MRGSKGFTIIELTLAMSFVALLLIAVAMLSIQLTNQYSRGVTMKEIAQAGTEASNDIKRTLGQTQIQGSGIRTKTVATGGVALCTGTYSYVANSPDNLENLTVSSPNMIKVGTGSSRIAARLAKVRDIGGRLCDATSQLDTAPREITSSDVSELLASGSRLLVVRALTVTPVNLTTDANGIPVSGAFYEEYKKGRGLYTVSLTIGTGIGSEFVADNTRCKAPSETDSNEEFCAIDTFKFTTRVGSSNR